jgi:DNA-binding IclR family transcriptional regulator
MEEYHTGYTVKNVMKSLEILEKLSECPEPIPLQSLAESIGLNPAKTFRLLSILQEKELVDIDSVSGSYQLGLRTLAFGRKLIDSFNNPAADQPNRPKIQESSDLVSYSHPIMEQLARKYDEAVYMTVIKNNEVLFLNMVDCTQQIKTEPLVGRKFPFFTNAAGKVIKAVDSWDLLEKLRKRDESPGRWPDMDKLASELQEIRATGVAVDNGGLGDGIISVAVAVRDYAGKVVGALTMLGPSFRMLADRIDNEIIPSMLEGADLLSQRFGHAHG